MAGDFDYETHGAGYGMVRRADPRIGALVHAQLGPARTVLNVGAGAGSYEPLDRVVTAVEPSASMRSQRPAHLTTAIDATAEHLPFDDNAFDAAMATITVHQWADTDRGLREMRRVATGPVVVLTFDSTALDLLWLADYVPELIAAERRRYPAIAHVADVLGGNVTVQPVPVSADCTDGFTEAFYARPEGFLDPAVRRSQSAWGFVDDAVIAVAIGRLADDIESGAWDRRYGHLRGQAQFEGSLRLITARPA